MPTYEYKCDACEHAFEQFQSITAAPVKKCPKCGRSKVRRLISAGGGMIFKGSGFYITDYRSDKYQDAAKADTAPTGESKSDSKSDGKSESKADSKSETKTESKTDAKSETKSAESTSASSKPAESKNTPAPTASKSAAKPVAKSSGKSGKSGK